VAGEEEDDVALEVGLGLPFVVVVAGLGVEATTAFLFFFSSAACEWVIMASVGFHARGPLSTGTRGGRPSFPAVSVALEVVLAAATVDRTTPVVPNRFRGIGAVDSDGIASTGKSAGLRNQAPVTFGTGEGTIPAPTVLGGRGWRQGGRG